MAQTLLCLDWSSWTLVLRPQVQRENVPLHHQDRPAGGADPRFLPESVSEAAVLPQPLQPRPRHRQVPGELLGPNQNQIQWVSAAAPPPPCQTVAGCGSSVLASLFLAYYYGKKRKLPKPGGGEEALGEEPTKPARRRKKRKAIFVQKKRRSSAVDFTSAGFPQVRCWKNVLLKKKVKTFIEDEMF